MCGGDHLPHESPAPLRIGGHDGPTATTGGTLTPPEAEDGQIAEATSWHPTEAASGRLRSVLDQRHAIAMGECLNLVNVDWDSVLMDRDQGVDAADQCRLERLKL